ncbi:transposable element Tcb2 transposase [Trichonephila clavipes]|nr:transposable element Tcb2 transposase [Trichonephila clavipes]
MAYLNILQNNLKENADKLGLGSNFIFQQDNDPKHTAFVVKEWLLYHCRYQLNTPPQSPDFNVIENLWSHLERAVQKHQITSKEQLKSVLQEEWLNIAPDTPRHLVESMPRRLEAVISAKGDESRVFEWFRRFKESRQSVNSDPRSGRPSTSRNEDKIAQVKAVVLSDRCLTVQEIAQECHISVGSCDEILRKNLNMRRVSAKFVPRLLTENQQFQRLATSSHLFQRASDNPEFMRFIIPGDESWAYGCNPGCTHGIVHQEFAPQCQTVNKEFYLDVTRRLREAVRRKRPVLWASSRWMLHHDGAPMHAANLVQQFLTKHGTIQVAHPPYSPYMSPPDIFLFPKIKNTLKGHRVQDIETIKQNSTQQLQAIPKSEFQKCFDDSKHR